jgi:hypothetical protein
MGEKITVQRRNMAKVTIIKKKAVSALSSQTPPGSIARDRGTTGHEKRATRKAIQLYLSEELIDVLSSLPLKDCL